MAQKLKQRGSKTTASRKARAKKSPHKLKHGSTELESASAGIAVRQSNAFFDPVHNIEGALNHVNLSPKIGPLYKASQAEHGYDMPHMNPGSRASETSALPGRASIGSGNDRLRPVYTYRFGELRPFTRYKLLVAPLLSAISLASLFVFYADTLWIPTGLATLTVLIYAGSYGLFRRARLRFHKHSV